eukprot:scaffold42107_cov62-Phaeocystis_antarctica.AAC.4
MAAVKHAARPAWKAAKHHHTLTTGPPARLIASSAGGSSATLATLALGFGLARLPPREQHTLRHGDGCGEQRADGERQREGLERGDHRRVVSEQPGAAQWHGRTEERGRHT